MFDLQVGFLPFVAVLVLFVFSSIKILREYERGVIFLLGRFWKVKGPGLVIVIPGIQQIVKVDLRVVTMDVPSQDVISWDNVSVQVNAIVFFRVVDPEKAIIQVETIWSPPASWPRPPCARCSASTNSTRCSSSASGSTSTCSRSSMRRPTAGASR